jgi:hypothetical protein
MPKPTPRVLGQAVLVVTLTECDGEKEMEVRSFGSPEGEAREPEQILDELTKLLAAIMEKPVPPPTPTEAERLKEERTWFLDYAADLVVEMSPELPKEEARAMVLGEMARDLGRDDRTANSTPANPADGLPVCHLNKIVGPGITGALMQWGSAELTIGQLARMSDDELMGIRRIGYAATAKIRHALTIYGYEKGGSTP